ncbi:hypothetical protein DFH06DRAFT_376054 [Mycena polygramma]|nr:hypothetical protein DFH06DRAFT_376054 [Mycena polygramma]
MALSDSPTPSQSPLQQVQADSAFPISQSNSSSSKLTSSDKLSELPVSSRAASPNRVIRSQNARAFRHSLDSLPSFSSGDSPRIGQAWGTIPASKSFPQTVISGNDTPKQRVSFDSDRPQGFGRDAALDAASQSRSRAASPLRILQHLSAGFRRRNDPFVPVNPFEFTRAGFYSCFHLNLTPTSELDKTDTKIFFTDTLPRQIYLHLLLRLPSMYFSRVARIFEDAEVSRPDIERMIDAGIGGDALELDMYSPPASARESLASVRATTHGPLPVPDEWTPAVVSPALIRFKHSWEDFIGSLIKEWKTLNVVSALLLSAILTMFQIPPIASNPVTRTTALLSLVNALMSLCYGCVYIVRFATMRSMYRASKFAEEARKTDTLIWWNVWTLLAMPAVFLAWFATTPNIMIPTEVDIYRCRSVVFFIMSITSFVWRTGSVLDPDERQLLGPHAVLGPRIAVTAVLLLGLLYFALIISTLRRYGEPPVRGREGDTEAQTGTRGRTVERTPSRRVKRADRQMTDRTDADPEEVVEKGGDFGPVVAGQKLSAGPDADMRRNMGTAQL